MQEYSSVRKHKIPPTLNLARIRTRLMKNTIIQKGPLLLTSHSIIKLKELKINCKQIHLERKISKSNPITYRKDYSQATRINEPRLLISRSNTASKKETHFSKVPILKICSSIDQNPFQNIALKSPLSKRSFTAIKRQIIYD